VGGKTSDVPNNDASSHCSSPMDQSTCSSPPATASKHRIISAWNKVAQAASSVLSRAQGLWKSVLESDSEESKGPSMISNTADSTSRGEGAGATGWKVAGSRRGALVSGFRSKASKASQGISNFGRGARSRFGQATSGVHGMNDRWNPTSRRTGPRVVVL